MIVDCRSGQSPARPRGSVGWLTARVRCPVPRLEVAAIDGWEGENAIWGSATTTTYHEVCNHFTTVHTSEVAKSRSMSLRVGVETVGVDVDWLLLLRLGNWSVGASASGIGATRNGIRTEKVLPSFRTDVHQILPSIRSTNSCGATTTNKHCKMRRTSTMRLTQYLAKFFRCFFFFSKPTLQIDRPRPDPPWFR